MVTSVSPTDSTPHHDNVLRTLCRLADWAEELEEAEFVFDVPLKRYAVLTHGGRLPVTSGDLTLAIYNDLKVSQYILENDGLTTCERRRFSLTDRGRRVAAIAVCY